MGKQENGESQSTYPPPLLTTPSVSTNKATYEKPPPRKHLTTSDELSAAGPQKTMNGDTPKTTANAVKDKDHGRHAWWGQSEGNLVWVNDYGG